MGVPKVIYKCGKEDIKDPWIRYIKGRIYENNKNFLCAIVGPTGSGKTYTGISICEKISRMNNVPFTIDNIVFDLKSLMALINSDRLKKGSCILFDEPQVSISNREFQSKANKVFNYLLTTFRHRNFIFFFCTPYEDLLDKTSRKLFHGNFMMDGIDKKAKTSFVRPYYVEYNSKNGNFYNKFLRVVFYPKGKKRFKSLKQKRWDVELASKELLREYETKKMMFTKELNLQIEMELDADMRKKEKMLGKKELTDSQDKIYKLLIANNWDVPTVAKLCNLTTSTIYDKIKYIRKKGYTVKTKRRSFI